MAFARCVAESCAAHGAAVLEAHGRQHSAPAGLRIPQSYSNQPSCLRQIEVEAHSGPNSTSRGDDASRAAQGTYWFESIVHDDDCTNTFPLAYGAGLKGNPNPDWEKIGPKPLLREVVYDISTTTGATGYGGGRFIIHPDGRVENLPYKVSC